MEDLFKGDGDQRPNRAHKRAQDDHGRHRQPAGARLGPHLGAQGEAAGLGAPRGPVHVGTPPGLLRVAAAGLVGRAAERGRRRRCRGVAITVGAGVTVLLVLGRHGGGRRCRGGPGHGCDDAVLAGTCSRCDLAQVHGRCRGGGGAGGVVGLHGAGLGRRRWRRRRLGARHVATAGGAGDGGGAGGDGVRRAARGLRHVRGPCGPAAPPPGTRRPRRRPPELLPASASSRRAASGRRCSARRASSRRRPPRRRRRRRRRCCCSCCCCCCCCRTHPAATAGPLARCPSPCPRPRPLAASAASLLSRWRFWQRRSESEAYRKVL